jgi:hypothetical protein
VKIRVVLRFKALATRFFTDAVEKSSVASCTYLNSSGVYESGRSNGQDHSGPGVSRRWSLVFSQTLLKSLSFFQRGLKSLSRRLSSLSERVTNFAQETPLFLVDHMVVALKPEFREGITETILDGRVEAGR